MSIPVGLSWAVVLMIGIALMLFVPLTIAILRSKRPGLGLAATAFLGLPVIAMLVGLMAVRTRQVNIQPHNRQDAIVMPVEASPEWLSADEHFLDADVYPSAQAAARSLTRLLWDEAGPERPSGVAVYVEFMGEVIAEALGEADPPPKVVVTNSGVQAIGIDTWISARTSQPGVLTVQLGSSKGSKVRSARFVDKPWVEDFPAFLAAQQGTPWMLAQSKSPALSAHEAEQQAYSDAARQLAPLVHLRTGPRLSRVGGGAGAAPDLQLTASIVQKLRHPDQRFITDRFVQKFERPGGDVYRAALLIRPPPGSLEAIAAQYVQAHDEQRFQWVRLIVSGGALLGVLTLLYLFLNAATKGYYALSIRVAVLVMGLAGLAAVLLMA